MCVWGGGPVPWVCHALPRGLGVPRNYLGWVRVLQVGEGAPAR